MGKFDLSMYQNMAAPGEGLPEAVASGVAIGGRLSELGAAREARGKEAAVAGVLGDPASYMAAPENAPADDPEGARAAAELNSVSGAPGTDPGLQRGTLGDLNRGARLRVAQIDPKWAMTLEEFVNTDKRQAAEMKSWSLDQKAKKLEMTITATDRLGAIAQEVVTEHDNWFAKSRDPFVAAAHATKLYQGYQKEVQDYFEIIGAGDAPTGFDPEHFNEGVVSGLHGHSRTLKKALFNVRTQQGTSHTLYSSEEELPGKLAAGETAFKMGEMPAGGQDPTPYTDPGKASADLKHGLIDPATASRLSTPETKEPAAPAVREEEQVDGSNARFKVTQQWDPRARAWQETNRVPVAGNEGPDTANVELSVKRDYDGRSEGFRQVVGSVDTIMTAEPTGTGDVVLITALARLIDPNARAVTDSDFRNFQRAPGLPGVVEGMLNWWIGNGSLSGPMRDDVKRQAVTVLETRIKDQESLEADAESFLAQRKLRSAGVVEPWAARGKQRIEQYKPKIGAHKEEAGTAGDSKPRPKLPEQGKAADFGSWTDPQLYSVDITKLDDAQLAALVAERNKRKTAKK